jgi:hypothetical protein
MAAKKGCKPPPKSPADHGGRKRKTHLRLGQPSDSGNTTQQRDSGTSVTEEEEAILCGRVDPAAGVPSTEALPDQ